MIGPATATPVALEQLQGQAVVCPSTSVLGRLLEPEEVAFAIACLCSAANVAMTGEIIRGSGGYATP